MKPVLEHTVNTDGSVTTRVTYEPQFALFNVNGRPTLARIGKRSS